MHGPRAAWDQPHKIKLEVIGDEVSLQPDPFGLTEAAVELVKLGFQVLPYCTEDWVLCRRLMDTGFEVIMPWAAPIGTGQGPRNPRALRELRHRAPQVRLMFRKIDNETGVAVTLSNMAHAMSSQGDLRGARKRFEDSLALSRSVGDDAREAVALKGLAILLWRPEVISSALKECMNRRFKYMFGKTTKAARRRCSAI
jgi:hypothetical protein